MATPAGSASTSRTRQFLLFLLVFAMGLLLFFLATVLPLRKVGEAKAWAATPCTIVSSEVERERRHTSDGSRTFYRPAVRYRYTFDGKERTGSRYSFATSSSTSPRKSNGIIADYPEGSEHTCFVNPADPSEAVLARGTHPVFLLGFLGIPLAALGAGGMWTALFGRRRRVGAPDAAGWVPLRPKQTRLRNFLIGLVILLTVGIITAFAAAESIFIMTAISGLITAAVFLGVIHSFLALFNPRIAARVAGLRVAPGAAVEVAWEFRGKAERVKRFTLELRCVEERRERRARGKTSIRRETVETVPVLETDVPSDMLRGQVQCWLPENARPSGVSGNTTVTWQLCFKGEIPFWPDMSEEYEVEVTAPGQQAGAPLSGS